MFFAMMFETFCAAFSLIEKLKIEIFVGEFHEGIINEFGSELTEHGVFEEIEPVVLFVEIIIGGAQPEDFVVVGVFDFEFVVFEEKFAAVPVSLKKVRVVAPFDVHLVVLVEADNEELGGLDGSMLGYLTECFEFCNQTR